jgi:hypothetical protein
MPGLGVKRSRVRIPPARPRNAGQRARNSTRAARKVSEGGNKGGNPVLVRASSSGTVLVCEVCGHSIEDDVGGPNVKTLQRF